MVKSRIAALVAAVSLMGFMAGCKYGGNQNNANANAARPVNTAPRIITPANANVRPANANANAKPAANANARPTASPRRTP